MEQTTGSGTREGTPSGMGPPSGVGRAIGGWGLTGPSFEHCSLSLQAACHVAPHHVPYADDAALHRDTAKTADAYSLPALYRPARRRRQRTASGTRPVAILTGNICSSRYRAASARSHNSRVQNTRATQPFTNP